MKSKFECYIKHDIFPSILSFHRGGQMPLKALVFVRVMWIKQEVGLSLMMGLFRSCMGEIISSSGQECRSSSIRPGLLWGFCSVRSR